ALARGRGHAADARAQRAAADAGRRRPRGRARAMNEHGPTSSRLFPAAAGGGGGEDALDALLRRHFAEALDPLTGRAAIAAFPPRRLAPPRLTWGTLALAAAACLLLAVALWATLAAAPPAVRHRPLAIVPTGQRPAQLIADAGADGGAHAVAANVADVAARPEVLRSVA